MNLTSIASIPSSQNWKRVKGQYVAAVAGVAIAVSAVVAFGPNNSNSKPAAPVRQASLPAVSRNFAAPQSFFFIAADAAQKAQLEAADSELRSLDPGRTDIIVLLAGSREADLLQTEGARELSAAGARFTISDFSRPLQAYVGPKASDADVMASVVSTELATYVVPATQVQPQFGTAADAEYAAQSIRAASMNE